MARKTKKKKKYGHGGRRPNQTGRPPIDDPRAFRLTLALTKAELETLRDAGGSQWVREKALAAAARKKK